MTDWPCILVIESKTDQVARMTERLTAHFPNGRVVCAPTAAEAEKLDLKQADLILLGYHLPDCTGLELLRRLKLSVTVPIVMVTSLRSPDAAASAIQAGAADYIVKTEDYLDVLPVMVEKNLVTASLRANVARLREELRRGYEELRAKNAELEARNAQLREAALRDPLTGIYNRRYINEVVEQFVAQALRYTEDLGCMMIDLDQFKRANDELGHLTGDRLLQVAAGAILSSVRASDVVARFGGDEFIVLLPKSSSADAYACAERVTRCFRETLQTEVPAAARLTLSIGIASLIQGNFNTARELIAAADRAMYVCKTNGGNGIFPDVPIAA
jgi:diguanylate cyclase (GGDEF)-like protein